MKWTFDEAGVFNVFNMFTEGGGVVNYMFICHIWTLTRPLF